MKKRYIAGILAAFIAVGAVLTPVSVNAGEFAFTAEGFNSGDFDVSGFDLNGFDADSLDTDGIKTGEGVVDRSYEDENRPPEERKAGQEADVSANVLSENDLSLQEESVFSFSGALEAPKPSKTSITNAIYYIYGDSDYSLLDIRPNTAPPYSLGQVSAAHRQKALDSVNLMRMIGGLPRVYIHDFYNELTQYGAVVLAANDSLTHTPARPAGMDDTFYENGYAATSQSNIAYGWVSGMDSYFNMPRFTLGYMDDSGANNVPVVGHRRWILNPPMLYTGFGFALNGRNAAYSAMYAFNRNGTTPDYDFISWPASGNFPSEFGNMEMPWHVTLNPAKFDISRMNTGNVEVTVTAPDGRKQTINASNTAGNVGDKNQPYFNIDKEGYGIANAIIFRPGTGVFGGDDLRGIYNVTVSGLYTRNGAPAKVSYNIDFFSATYYMGGSDNEAVNDKGINGFIERLYTLCFGREADDDGFIYWRNALIDKSKSGAVVAHGFFLSDEMKLRNLSDDAFVELLYRVMMDRASDPSGKAYWLERLSGGVSREGVFKGFAESAEFTNICASYGIDRGSAPVSQGRDRNTGLTMFVSRLYTKALGRPYDISGLNDWCSRILNGSWSLTDAATTGFFHSPEFLNKKLSNEEYVKVLYRTFLGREYDKPGLNDWVNQLNSGQKSRDEVLRGFSGSREFADIMRQYGL